MGKEITVSGIRPTGALHLGNYVGAMQNYVKMQNEFDCFFFIADWHSLTTHPDTVKLKEQVKRAVAEYIAAGLDPQKVTIYLQSAIPEIAELYLYLGTLTYKGELEKTTTFKEKVRSQPENINAGLLTYPVLMAADILIHRAKKVPVGKDQEQHLEMTRNLAERFNYRYSEFFPMPEAYNFGENLIKIMGLDGNGKMSKSENQLATIYLSDENEWIRKKIMKAKTDSGPVTEFAQKPDYIENLFTLMKLVSSTEVFTKFDTDFQHCRIRYGDMKKQLAEDMISFISPIRSKANEILKDENLLSKILKEGAEKARLSASNTLYEVRHKMGLTYFA
ncbi:MAG: tryptophan--tRNA ligase [Bacteroidetes bacterium]|nr:tryptophan--tRNA ligase [Bacteroidota bacterium]